MKIGPLKIVRSVVELVNTITDVTIAASKRLYAACPCMMPIMAGSGRGKASEARLQSRSTKNHLHERSLQLLPRISAHLLEWQLIIQQNVEGCRTVQDDDLADHLVSRLTCRAQSTWKHIAAFIYD